MIISTSFLFLLFILSAITSKSMVIAGISIGDILLLVSSLLFFLLYIKEIKFEIDEIFLLVLLLIFAFISGLNANIKFEYFDKLEFFKSFFKLIFYSITFLIFTSLAKIISKPKAVKIIFYISAINALLALLIYIFQNLNININFYNFFWYGLEEPGKIGTDVKHWSIGNFTLIRLRGIFAEASLYGIYQSLSIAIILLNFPEILKKYKFVTSVIFLSIIFTYSISTYAIVFVIFITFLINYKTRGVVFSLILSYTPILIVCLILFFLLISSYGFFEVFYERIFLRISDFLQGNERSGVQRFNQSFVTAVTGLKSSILFGSGLGNLELLFNQKEYSTFYITGINELVSYSARMHIIPYSILGELGLIGFLIFTLLLFKKLNIKNFYLFIFYILVLYSSGTYLDSFFWITFALIRLLDGIGTIEQKKYNKL